MPEGMLRSSEALPNRKTAPYGVIAAATPRQRTGPPHPEKPAMERFLDSQRGFRRKNYVFDLQTTLTVEQFWGEAVRQWNYHP